MKGKARARTSTNIKTDWIDEERIAQTLLSYIVMKQLVMMDEKKSSDDLINY